MIYCSRNNNIKKFIKVYIYKGISLKRLKYYCKFVDINELEFNILKDYYVNRNSREQLAYKYHYSIYYIDELKSKALNKIYNYFEQ